MSVLHFTIISDKLDSTCRVLERQFEGASYRAGAVHELQRLLRSQCALLLSDYDVQARFQHREVLELVRRYCAKCNFATRASCNDLCEQAYEFAHVQLSEIDASFPSRATVEADHIHVAVVILVLHFLVRTSSSQPQLSIGSALESSLDHFHRCVVVGMRATPRFGSPDHPCSYSTDTQTVETYYRRVAMSRIRQARNTLVNNSLEEASRWIAQSTGNTSTATVLTSKQSDMEAEEDSLEAEAPARSHGTITVRPVSAGSNRTIIHKQVQSPTEITRQQARNRAVQSALENLQHIPSKIRHVSSRKSVSNSTSAVTRRSLVAILRQAANEECDAMRQVRRDQDFIHNVVDLTARSLATLQSHHHGWSSYVPQLEADKTAQGSQLSRDEDCSRGGTAAPIRSVKPISRPTRLKTRLDGQNIVSPSPEAIERVWAQHPGSHYPTTTFGATQANAVLQTRKRESNRFSVQLAEAKRTNSLSTRSSASNSAKQFAIRWSHIHSNKPTHNL